MNQVNRARAKYKSAAVATAISMILAPPFEVGAFLRLCEDLQRNKNLRLRRSSKNAKIDFYSKRDL